MDRARPRGVKPKGDRIELTFFYEGKRYRPTLDLRPTAANLRIAARRLHEVQVRIRDGRFSFREEFPDYKRIKKVAPVDAGQTFDQVADAYLKSLVRKQHATQESYRKILKAHWRSGFGDQPIKAITFRQLREHMDERAALSPKTHNNVISVARMVFQFAIKDELINADPSQHLTCLKVQREPPDPYSIDEALEIIAGLKKQAGPHIANYFEFAFFTGARPSEMIALLWDDVDLRSGKVKISKARVMAKDKPTVKNYKPRTIALNPRALSALHRQGALNRLAGSHVFCREDGSPIHDLQVPWKAWRSTHKRLGIRYREPYHTRHTSVTWNLMIGKNLLWVAKQHGHSPGVMLKVYSDWMEECDDEAIERIRREMDNGAPDRAPTRSYVRAKKRHTEKSHQ